MRVERGLARRRMESGQPPLYDSVRLDPQHVHEVVLSYLVHHCFKESADAFVAATGMKVAADYAASIDRRKPIRESVLQGEGLRAIQLAKALGGNILERHPEVHFELLLLHYFELVRGKDWTAAFEFAQSDINHIGRQDPYVKKWENCLGLLAYEEPEAAPMRSLLSLDNRCSVADSLNRAILEEQNLPTYAALERLVQQMTVVRKCLLQEALVQGSKDAPPPFDLQTFLDR